MAEERAPASAYSKEAREFIHEHVKKHVEEKKMPQKQAVAAALSEARRQGLKVPNERATKKGE